MTGDHGLNRLSTGEFFRKDENGGRHDVEGSLSDKESSAGSRQKTCDFQNALQFAKGKGARDKVRDDVALFFSFLLLFGLTLEDQLWHLNTGRQKIT